MNVCYNSRLLAHSWSNPAPCSMNLVIWFKKKKTQGLRFDLVLMTPNNWKELLGRTILANKYFQILLCVWHGKSISGMNLNNTEHQVKYVTSSHLLVFIWKSTNWLSYSQSFFKLLICMGYASVYLLVQIFKSQ